MTNAAINAAIAAANSAIFNGEEIALVKDYCDGHKAFANNSGSAVAIFAEIEEGEFFNISGWVKNPNKSLAEIADSLYS